MEFSEDAAWLLGYDGEQNDDALGRYDQLVAIGRRLESFAYSDNSNDSNEAIWKSANAYLVAECIGYRYAQRQGKRIRLAAIGPHAGEIRMVVVGDVDPLERPRETNDMNWAVYCFLTVRYPEFIEDWNWILRDVK